MIKVHLVKRKRRPYYFLRWTDPNTKWPRERSSGERRKRDAWIRARELEYELNRESEIGVYWDDFANRYETEHTLHLSAKSQQSWLTTRHHFERLANKPEYVGDITRETVQRFANQLRREGKPETTVHAYLSRLRAALNWGYDAGILSSVPRFKMPKLGHKLARSRSITLEEFERLLTCVPLVRPGDAEAWVRVLSGLWESGFRVSELLRLSWSPAAAWSIQTNGIPLVRIRQQKSGDEQLQPITPAFWELLKSGPRDGYAFPLPGKSGQISEHTAIRVIAEIGKRSGIITDPVKGKTVTSHDLRRSFACRIGKDLTLLELSQWMRHASANTTKTYYHVQDAETLANRVW